MTAWKCCAPLMLMLPLLGHAAELPAGPLSDVLALPSATGTIAGTTFAFNYPQNGVPEFFAGPWAGEPYWGPASAVTFTPLADADNPGFTLGGDFHATAGLLYEIALGAFLVTAPEGMLIDSVSVEIANPVASDNSVYAYMSVNCAAVPSQPSATCERPSLTNSAYFNIDLRIWNSATPSAVGFDSATFRFHESPASPVPEPAAAGLMGIGALALIGALRRRRAAGFGA